MEGFKNNLPMERSGGKEERMKCKLCQKYYKKYPLKENRGELMHEIDKALHQSPIECAFENDNFSTDNWCCQTLSELRDLCEEKGHYERDDMRCASIGVLPIPESEDNNVQQGYLVMTWYKDRGRTGQAWVMWDDELPKKLNLKTAQFIVSQSDKIN